MALTQTQVSMLYVAIFNRASEGEGNKFWQNEAELATGATAMLGASDAISYFGSSLNSNKEFIEHIYLNTLNKTSDGANGTVADAKGIQFWVDLLEIPDEITGVVKTRGEVVAGLVEAAVNPATAGNARDQFLNRVAVSDHAAAVLDKAPADYQNVLGFDAGLPVDHTETSEIAADLIIDNLGSGTFTLTENPDKETANIFNAGRVFDPSGDDQMNSLQDDDVLTGVGTNPTLNFDFVTDTQTNDYDVSPTLVGIETVNVKATHSGTTNGAHDIMVVDFQDATGLNALNITRMDASLTLDNMVNTQANLSVANSNEIDNALSFLYTDAALKGTADSTILTMSNATITTLTVEEVANGNQGYETINLVSDSSANRIATALVAEDLATLNITGTESLFVGGIAEAGSLTKVDASAFAANLDFTISDGVIDATPDGASNGDVAFAFTSFSGDDNVRISDQIGTTDTIATGTGTDNLIIEATDPTENYTATHTSAQITGVEAVQLWNSDADTAVIAFLADQADGDQSFILRNNTDTAGNITTYNVMNLSATEATQVTVQHSGNTSNNGAASSNALANNIVNLDVASGVTTATVTLGEGVNSDPTFNFELQTDSDLSIVDSTGALVASNANNGTNTVTSLTLVDTDSESNTVQLIAESHNSSNGNRGQGTAYTDTITITGGATGTWFNLDATISGNATNAAVTTGGFGYDVTGITTNANTEFTTSTNRDTDVSEVFFGDDGANTGERLVATTITSTSVSDVTLRLGSASQAITTGTGNDNFIFDNVEAGTTTLSTAGLTSADKITAGTGTDTLIIDGNHTTDIVLGSSEWSGLSGIDILRFGDNNGVDATTAESFDVTITDQFIDQTDSTDRLTIINNDGDLATNSENAVRVALTGLAATNSVTFEGADSSGGTGATRSSTVIVDDVSTNSNFILNGGDGNTTATTVNTGAGNVASGNSNILQIHNTTVATVDDLTNITNFSTINFLTREATDQTLTLTLTDTLVGQLVDDSNTTSSTTPTVETLTITAFDNPNVSNAILNIDASTLTVVSSLNITSGGGADQIILGAGTDTIGHLVANTGTLAANVDAVTGFTAGTDIVDFTDLTNSDLRGAGVDYEALAVTAGVVAIGANTGLIVNTGANSTDLLIATQVTSLAASNGNIGANDSFYYVTDDGVNSALFLFNDADAGGDVDAGEVSIVMTFVGITDATTLTAASFADFV